MAPEVAGIVLSSKLLRKENAERRASKRSIADIGKTRCSLSEFASTIDSQRSAVQHTRRALLSLVANAVVEKEVPTPPTTLISSRKTSLERTTADEANPDDDVVGSLRSLSSPTVPGLNGSSDGYDYRADVFSLGIVIAEVNLRMSFIP